MGRKNVLMIYSA